MKISNLEKVVAFERITQISDSFGASYNPGNVALQSTALATLLKLAKERAHAVIAAHSAYILAVSARADSFEGIPKLAVRVVHLASASGVSKGDLENVKMIKRRLFQQRRKQKPVEQGENADNDIPRTHSTSMLDRDSIMHTMEHLIDFVQRISGYESFDPELTVEGLKARLAELHALNFAAQQAQVNLSNARIARDKVLDGPGGVVETTAKVKSYIRAKFGYFSMEARLTRRGMI